MKLVTKIRHNLERCTWWKLHFILSCFGYTHPCHVEVYADKCRSVGVYADKNTPVFLCFFSGSIKFLTLCSVRVRTYCANFWGKSWLQPKFSWIVGLNINDPDSQVHGANVGPIWGLHASGEPHVGPMNFAICGMCVAVINMFIPCMSFFTLRA